MISIRKIVGCLAISALALVQTAVAAPDRTLNVPVTIRPGVRALLRLPVFVNHHRVRDGITILAVPGLAHDAESFEAFADQIFNTPDISGRVERVVGVQFPGKGGSSLPFPASRLHFGEMTLDDYSNVLLEVLERLDRRRNDPDMIVAHSMGGLIVQMAQDRLIARGRTLRREFGIRDVMLLASGIPGNLPWALVDSGAYAQLASQFVAQSEELGTYLSIPAPVWLGLFFANRSGQLFASDPNFFATFDTNEAFGAAAQLGGVGVPRAMVRQGEFSAEKGSTLSVVTFEQDPFYVYPAEHSALYGFLRNGNGSGLFQIPGVSTVHDTYIQSPQLLADAVRFHLRH